MDRCSFARLLASGRLRALAEESSAFVVETVQTGTRAGSLLRLDRPRRGGADNAALESLFALLRKNVADSQR